MRDRASGFHPDILVHLPPPKKPESAYCIALCSLHAGAPMNVIKGSLAAFFFFFLARRAGKENAYTGK